MHHVAGNEAHKLHVHLLHVLIFMVKTGRKQNNNNKSGVQRSKISSKRYVCIFILESYYSGPEFNILHFNYHHCSSYREENISTIAITLNLVEYS